jgi:hypothetical protein
VNDNQKRLQRRIIKVAEAALARRGFVSPIDVLMGIGWLSPPVVDQWRRGRLPYLERGATANLHKLSTAMHLFRSWAVSRGLRPRETAYLATTPDRRPLRFGVSGRNAVERGYRTHWVSPKPAEKKRQRAPLTEQLVGEGWMIPAEEPGGLLEYGPPP